MACDHFGRLLDAARRRALLTIPADAVDLAGGWIDFPPSSIKTNDGIRCRIGSDAIAAIRPLAMSTIGICFDATPIASAANSALLQSAGVPASYRDNCHFHKLRRTGATHAVIRGGMAVVCDLLGQSSIYVTKKYVDKSQLAGHDVTRLLPLLMDESAFQERSQA